MLDKAKLIWKAKQLEKELGETEIEAKTQDGLITVVVSAKLTLKKIEIDPAYLSPDKKELLEKQLESTIGQAMQKAQLVAAEKMKSLAGDLNLNLPGL